MIIVTTDYIYGKETEMLGLVKGCAVMTKNLGKDLAHGIRPLVAGGELPADTETMNRALELATARMTSEAEALGADAILGVRYSTSAITQGAAELVAYGTAVRLRN